MHAFTWYCNENMMHSISYSLIYFICLVLLLNRQVMRSKVKGNNVLIIQCASGDLNSNLIACARHRVVDEVVVPQSQPDDKEKDEHKDQNQDQTSASKDNNDTSSGVVHVVFIIQFPRKSGGTKFVGFQGGKWISVHLDDLRVQKDHEVSFQNSMQFSVGELFKNVCQHFTCSTSESNSISTALEDQAINFNANKRLHDLIQKACSSLYDTRQRVFKTDRTANRIQFLAVLIPIVPSKGKVVCYYVTWFQVYALMHNFVGNERNPLAKMS